MENNKPLTPAEMGALGGKQRVKNMTKTEIVAMSRNAARKRWQQYRLCSICMEYHCNATNRVLLKGRGALFANRTCAQRSKKPFYEKV